MPTAFSQTQEGVNRVIKLVQGLKGFAHSDKDQAKQAIDINEIIENTLVVSRNEYKYVADIEKLIWPISRGSWSIPETSVRSFST